MLSITNSISFAQTDSMMIETISKEEGLSNRHVHCIIGRPIWIFMDWNR